MTRTLSFLSVLSLSFVLAAPAAFAQSKPTGKPATPPTDDTAGENSGKSYDSPQAVFTAAYTLVKEKKAEHLVMLFAPDDRKFFSFQIYFAASFMAAFSGKEAKEELEKIGKEHGLKDMKDKKPDLNNPAEMRKFSNEMFAKVDLVKFSKAMFAFLDKHADEGGGPDMEKSFKGELKDVKIEGNKAVATGPDGKPVAFAKVKGSWWLSVDRPQPKKNK